MWLKLIEPLQFQIREKVLKLSGLKSNFLCPHFCFVMLKQFYRIFCCFAFGFCFCLFALGVLGLLGGFFRGFCMFLFDWLAWVFYKLILLYFLFRFQRENECQKPTSLSHQANLDTNWRKIIVVKNWFTFTPTDGCYGTHRKNKFYVNSHNFEWHPPPLCCLSLLGNCTYRC